MDNLSLEKTKSTLGINFDWDTGILELSGSSYPENAFEFFNPLMSWLKSYMTEKKKPIELNISISYLNTSSTKCMIDLVLLLEDYFQSGCPVSINWYYVYDDESILETGQEIREDTTFSFQLICVN